MSASLASPSTTETRMAQNFFVPLADSSAEGERVYNLFIEKTGIPLLNRPRAFSGSRFAAINEGAT